MKQWRVVEVEYAVLESALNDLSSQGWEIHTIIPHRLVAAIVASYTHKPPAQVAKVSGLPVQKRNQLGV
jgi:hypothetical protein